MQCQTSAARWQLYDPKDIIVIPRVTEEYPPVDNSAYYKDSLLTLTVKSKSETRPVAAWVRMNPIEFNDAVEKYHLKISKIMRKILEEQVKKFLISNSGSKHTERIGDMQKNGPNDLSQRVFMNKVEADKIATQLNNEIGSSIGERYKGADSVTITKKLIDEIYNNGWWTVSENPNNTFSIQKSKISKAQYQELIRNINNKGLCDLEAFVTRLSYVL